MEEVKRHEETAAVSFKSPPTKPTTVPPARSALPVGGNGLHVVFERRRLLDGVALPGVLRCQEGVVVVLHRPGVGVEELPGPQNDQNTFSRPQGSSVLGPRGAHPTVIPTVGGRLRKFILAWESFCQDS